MFAPEFIGQFLVAGLTVGCIYAVAGIGVAIVHNVTGVLNLAQGEFLMLGGMTAVSLIEADVPTPVAFGAAIAVTLGVGLLVERLAIRPLLGKASFFTIAIVTIGISIFIRASGLVIWDWQPRRIQSFFEGGALRVYGVLIQTQSLWVIGTVLFTLCALVFIFERTLLGKALSASAIDPLASQLMGVNPARMSSISFGLMATLGAIAGIVIAPITTTSYDIGLMMSLKGVVVAIVGAYRPVYVVVAGLALGVFEALSAGLVSSGYKDAIGLFVLIAFLVVMARLRSTRSET